MSACEAMIMDGVKDFYEYQPEFSLIPAEMELSFQVCAQDDECV